MKDALAHGADMVEFDVQVTFYLKGAKAGPGRTQAFLLVVKSIHIWYERVSFWSNFGLKLRQFF